MPPAHAGLKCSLDEVPGAGGGCDVDPLLEIRRVEELVRERMEHMERQLSELRREVREGPSKLRRSYTASLDESDPHRDPQDLTRVTPMRLDWSDAYVLEASTWDASLFVFHPCVGPLASAITIFASVTNVILQAWFCWLVLAYMSAPSVTESTLDGLLRFRIAAHSVEYADDLTQRSMISLMCNDGVPGKLTMAAGQSTLLKSLTDFGDDWGGGRSFMSLALILWLCFNMEELNAIYHFARSLTHIGLGDRTRISMTAGADESVCASLNADARTAFGGTAVGVSSVTCRVVCVSPRRFWFGMLLIVLPRLVLVVVQSWMGCSFLASTSTNQDLVLNAMALAFIADIDKVMYDVFVPRRIKTLLANLEPLPLAHMKPSKHSAGFVAVGKAAGVAGALCLLYFVKLESFWWRLDTAKKVLCSGNQDFVWAINQASGMVHVTRSNDDLVTAWAYHEQAIFQVVAPEIGNEFWNIDDDLVRLANAGEAQAVWEPRARTYSEAVFDTAYVNYLSAIHDFTVSDAGAILDCNDLSSGQTVQLNANESVDVSLISSCLRSWETTASRRVGTSAGKLVQRSDPIRFVASVRTVVGATCLLAIFLQLLDFTRDPRRAAPVSASSWRQP
ncbi:unnamed protein product [Prorocentrum cordatum]|uniref:Uncharacterized protein n=1 Tax=Prorocentrum cordatum TaxID=2364126 RepID=A0ABN9UCZ8_9DINO|nr:unnamed protein product [Polarella glacialis]